MSLYKNRREQIQRANQIRALVRILVGFSINKLWTTEESVDLLTEAKIQTVQTEGGFPIEIESQISKIITYSLAIFIL